MKKILKRFTGKSELSSLIVLGMHRSGTSSLAGSLQSMGVYSGEVYKWNPHNLKGNRENQFILDLNDQVLAYNGVKWDNPPDRNTPLLWSEAHKSKQKEIIKNIEYEAISINAPYWGFKDPRTLLTWPFWEPSLSKCFLIGTFRHPLAVAASLGKRNQMSLEKAFALWFYYNQRLLDLYYKKPFPILCFDQPETQYINDLKVVAEYFGLKQESIFFEDQLRNQVAPIAGEVHILPPKVKMVYDELINIYKKGLS